MKRISIIGSGGAGKSRFARRLGAITGLPVTHLDQIYWQPNWVEPARIAWRQSVEHLLSGDSWIIDGNFGGTMEIRLVASDTVIFLDLPPIICLYRVLKRFLRYRKTIRADMAEGCIEKMDLKFIGWIWGFRKFTRPRIESLIQKNRIENKVVRLRSTKEVESFLLNIFAIK